MQFPEGIAEALFVYNKMTRKFPTTVFREDGPVNDLEVGPGGVSSVTNDDTPRKCSSRCCVLVSGMQAGLLKVPWHNDHAQSERRWVPLCGSHMVHRVVNW